MTLHRPVWRPVSIPALPDIPRLPRPVGLLPIPRKDLEEHTEVIHQAIIFAGSAVLWANPAVAAATRLQYTVAAYYVHELGHVLWDRASYYFSSESSAPSPPSFQQGGGAGGTPPIEQRFADIDAIPAGSRVTKPRWKSIPSTDRYTRKTGYHYCKRGWVLVRVGKTNMCWKSPRKKSGWVDSEGTRRFRKQR